MASATSLYYPNMQVTARIRHAAALCAISARWLLLFGSPRQRTTQRLAARMPLPFRAPLCLKLLSHVSLHKKRLRGLSTDGPFSMVLGHSCRYPCCRFLIL